MARGGDGLPLAAPDVGPHGCCHPRQLIDVRNLAQPITPITEGATGAVALARCLVACLGAAASQRTRHGAAKQGPSSKNLTKRQEPDRLVQYNKKPTTMSERLRCSPSCSGRAPVVAAAAARQNKNPFTRVRASFRATVRSVWLYTREAALRARCTTNNGGAHQQQTG